MSINTHSKFYFGYDVDQNNSSLDFSEGGGEIQAVVQVGSYTMTEFAAEVGAALNQVGGQTYTVTVSRNSRRLTVSASGTFELLITSGTRSGTSVYSLAGFTGADLTGAITYTGDTASGSQYTTQFILQDFIPSEDFERASEASVNRAVGGIVEVIQFGVENFMEANFRYVTDIAQSSGSPIRNRPTGVADFRALLRFLRTKAPFEFMVDENDTATFEKMILESSPGEREGIGFKLRELINLGLPGFFESRILKFRVVE